MKKQITYSEHPTRATRRVHMRGDKQFRTYDTSAINPRRQAIPATIFALVLLLLAAGGVWYWFNNHFEGIPFMEEPGAIAHGTDVAIVIPEGATVADIGRTLKNGKLISRVDDFTQAVKDKGAEASLKPGAYSILGGTSIDEIIALLQAGPETTTFTVQEGLSIARTAAVVEEAYAGRISAEEFIEQASKADEYLADFPFLEGAYNNSLEGFLFPKTYAKTESDTADSIIRRMLTQYQSEVAVLDYSVAEERGLNAYDVLKLASVVEREAAADNRATVASVFYNRLAQDMALQSDATVAYLVNGDPTPEDLEIESPYNTYLNNGLPAGPICSPGLAAMQAVCAPEDTPYLYFYFTENEDGSMNYAFSETYDEHQDAIAEGDAGEEVPSEEAVE